MMAFTERLKQLKITSNQIIWKKTERKSAGILVFECSKSSLQEMFLVFYYISSKNSSPVNPALRRIALNVPLAISLWFGTVNLR